MKHPELSSLKDVFKKYPDIKAVYLFSSAASGNLHDESDLDLAIISDNKTLHRKKLEILTGLARLGFCNVNLVFPDESDIVMQHEAIRHNIVLYETSGFDRGTVYSDTIRKFLDFYPYLTVQRKAYKKRISHGTG
ncbi:MAG: nucleotidyltransferase domain-containing protein [Desulfobacterales bacterium]|nr:nucleotidyltransferase domain-containing protein [Desulfobacterales bacterium]